MFSKSCLFYGLYGRVKPNDDPELYQYYYHADHLGSASYLTNLDGEIAQHIEYVPFGEVFLEERNNKWNSPYLFNGKELDEETGLVYYGARYYDARVSNWLSVDAPLINGHYLNFNHDGGVLNSFNLGPYTYCRLSPVVLIDPDGNQYNNSILLTPVTKIVGRGFRKRTITTHYKFTESATHMLSLVTGVKKENIANAKVKFSKMGDAGASLTTGSSSSTATITHYYSDDAKYYGTAGDLTDSFAKRNAHEVGHIPQLKNGNIAHIASSISEYVSNILDGEDWHDGSHSTKEREADVGENVFKKFNSFLDKKHGKGTLENLFKDTSTTEKQKINQIDKFWKEFTTKKDEEK